MTSLIYTGYTCWYLLHVSNSSKLLLYSKKSKPMQWLTDSSACSARMSTLSSGRCLLRLLVNTVYHSKRDSKTGSAGWRPVSQAFVFKMFPSKNQGRNFVFLRPLNKHEKWRWYTVKKKNLAPALNSKENNKSWQLCETYSISYGSWHFISGMNILSMSNELLFTDKHAIGKC